MFKVQFNRQYVELKTPAPPTAGTPAGTSILTFENDPFLEDKYIVNYYSFYGADRGATLGDITYSPKNTQLIDYKMFVNCYLTLQDTNGFNFHENIPLADYKQIVNLATATGAKDYVEREIHKPLEVDYIPRRIALSKCFITVSNQLSFDWTKVYALPFYFAYMTQDEYHHYFARHHGHHPEDKHAHASHPHLHKPLPKK